MGDRVAPGAERKLVTVLLADLDAPAAGFDDVDPEDAGAALAGRLAEVRAHVERFGGLVEQVLAGRTMAVFGLPRTREDDPERAVLAALAIRDALGGGAVAGSVHVSVATGDALVRPPGSPGPAANGRLAGEPLTTCARLQELAAPGAVLVSEATALATGRSISYGPAGVDGVLHALAPRARAPGAGRLPPMVGRAAELRALTVQLEDTVRLRAPRLVTVLGPPGIGKSRLVAELAACPAAAGVEWRWAAPPPIGEPLTVAALAQPVRASAGVDDGDTPAQARAKLERLAADVLPAPVAGWAAGHLARLLGIADGPPAGDPGEALTAWRRLLYALAARRPLVLAVEDLHRADGTLLELLNDLVDPDTTGPAGAVPLLVVATARPELGDRVDGHTVLRLGDLPERDTARLLDDLLAGYGLPAELRLALLPRVGGNPLFAEEWVRMLRDHGAGVDTSLPTSVHAIVAARLDALGEGDAAVLRDAAVLGPTGWVGALTAVGGREPAALRACLERLADREFVRLPPRSRLAGEVEFAFGHALVREVAYGQVLRADRAAKHHQAAAWLQALPAGAIDERTELLAYHWQAALAAATALGQDVAGLASSARAALLAAGDRAAGLGAHATAAGYYQGAADLVAADDPLRPELLLRLGRARCQADGGGSDVLAEARDGLLAAGDAVRAAEAEMLLAELAFLAGRGGDRVEHLERASALAAEAPPSASKAAVLRGLMLHFAVASRHVEARAVAAQVLAMAERFGLRELEADALGTIGLARVDGGDAGGLADLERALATGGARAGTVLWHLNLAYARAALGNLGAAAAALDDAELAAERFGSARRLRSVRLQRVAASYWSGRWDEAVAVVDGLEARAAAGDRHYLEWECRLWRGRIRLARGGAEAAAGDAAGALALAREAADPQARNPTLAFAARVMLASGEGADDAAALAAELLGGLGGSVLGPEVGADLGLVLAELGVPPAELDRRGVPASPWLAAARDLASGGAAAAARTYDRIGARPDAALARLAAARDLATSGRDAEAAALLAPAAAFWREVGAEHHLAEAASLG